MIEYTMPAEKWDENNPSKEMIRHLILKHVDEAMHLHELKAYYDGQHKILNDTKKENKLVCNHAKDIADTASAYFIGNPVAYTSDEDIQPLLDLLDASGADEADGDNGLCGSIYGKAYEYIYAGEDEAELHIRNIPSEHTFKVTDDTIERRELFYVYYYKKEDATDTRVPIFAATVITQNYIWEINILDQDGPQMIGEVPRPHYMESIPVVEYDNNKDCIGDFELQISLIDAYNALMSDRITDKEQFIDAILAIYGTLITDEDATINSGKDGDTGGDVMETLKKKRVIEVPDGAKAEYLTRTFDENGVEVLKKALEQDIHKFSNIPCMTDEAFGGNVSGVAMEFKLLGMENITKVKSRYYRKGLRKRLKILCGWLKLKNVANIDPNKIRIDFTRGLPKNNLEISQIVSNLWGKVSQKTLLAQIPWVDNPDEEIAAVEEENQKSLERQQQMFGMTPNTPPEDTPDDQDGKKKPGESGDKNGDKADTGQQDKGKK